MVQIIANAKEAAMTESRLYTLFLLATGITLFSSLFDPPVASGQIGTSKVPRLEAPAHPAARSRTPITNNPSGFRLLSIWNFPLRKNALDADSKTIGTNGTKVQLWDFWNGQNQRWLINRDGRIVNLQNG